MNGTSTDNVLDGSIEDAGDFRDRRDDVGGTVAWYVFDGLGSAPEEVQRRYGRRPATIWLLLSLCCW